MWDTDKVVQMKLGLVYANIQYSSMLGSKSRSSQIEQTPASRAFPHLYLADDICQSLAACILTLDRLVGDPFSDDLEYLGKICIVWSEDNRIVAVGRKMH